jgi:type II secretory pathway pseudopilin PulG
MVIMIASIMAVVVLTQWQGATLNVYGQAEQVANDIRYAQALSMTKGQRFYFNKVSNTTYQILDLAGTPITFASGGTTMTLNSGITFGSFTNLPGGLVAFNGEGIPYSNTSTPGTVLSSAASISLTGGGKTNTVIIAPTTGVTTLQ